MYELTLNDRLFLPHCGCELTLQLAEGKGLILTGENGLGKTTILRRFFQDFEEKSLVSFVPQSELSTFFDRPLFRFKTILLTAGEGQLNVKRFLHLWANFGLAEKEERRLADLSGGERQALKLVCGLSKESPLLMLDEPSQFLDAEKKNVLAANLQALKEERKSLLMVEHDLTWTKDWEVVGLKNMSGSVREERRWTI